MSSHALALAGVFTLTLTSVASAETVTWGQLEFRAGALNVSNQEGNADLDPTSPGTYDFSGRIGVDWGAFGGQLDLNYGAQDIDGEVDDGYYYGRFAAIRTTYDFSPAFTLGAVYGAGKAAPADDDIADFDFYALESAFSTGAGIYGLQLGAFDSTDPEETDTFHDGTFLRGAAIFTLGNGGVIEGEVAYFDGSQDSDGDYDMRAYTWGIEYSRQIGANPFAWSIGVDGGHFTNGDGSDNGAYDETRITLGLTTWFGDDDYGSAKRRGIFSQPEFGRIVVAGSNID